MSQEVIYKYRRNFQSLKMSVFSGERTTKWPESVRVGRERVAVMGEAQYSMPSDNEAYSEIASSST